MARVEEPLRPNGAHWFALPLDAVRLSIERLQGQRIHEFFPAYLYLRQLIARNPGPEGVKPSWNRGLGDAYLAVRGGPPGRPYFRPFRGQESEEWWLNRNLAGSFAPSSLRSAGPAPFIVSIDQQKRFHLRPEHWKMAREKLLRNEPVPVLALAGFLLRDYGFLAVGLPQGPELIAAFRDEFGYSGDDDEEFEHLYSTEPVSGVTAWFEVGD